MISEGLLYELHDYWQRTERDGEVSLIPLIEPDQVANSKNQNSLKRLNLGVFFEPLTKLNF